jgi:hypothetical protein
VQARRACGKSLDLGTSVGYCFVSTGWVDSSKNSFCNRGPTWSDLMARMALTMASARICFRAHLRHLTWSVGDRVDDVVFRRFQRGLREKCNRIRVPAMAANDDDLLASVARHLGGGLLQELQLQVCAVGRRVFFFNAYPCNRFPCSSAERSRDELIITSRLSPKGRSQRTGCAVNCAKARTSRRRNSAFQTSIA